MTSSYKSKLGWIFGSNGEFKYRIVTFVLSNHRDNLNTSKWLFLPMFLGLSPFHLDIP